MDYRIDNFNISKTAISESSSGGSISSCLMQIWMAVRRFDEIRGLAFSIVYLFMTLSHPSDNSIMYIERSKSNSTCMIHELFNVTVRDICHNKHDQTNIFRNRKRKPFCKALYSPKRQCDTVTDQIQVGGVLHCHALSCIRPVVVLKP